MADVTLNTRISLKYDSLANWQASNPKLLAGEIALVTVPAAADSITQAPSVVFKVGDGAKQFNDLPWGSALSADVYSWAKAATKPTYTATEVGAYSTSDTDTKIKTAVEALDATVTAESGKFITGITQVDGKITSVTSTAIPAAPIYTLESNEDGKLVLKKDGSVASDVEIQGWAELVQSVTNNLETAKSYTDDQIAAEVTRANAAYDATGAAKAVQGSTTSTVKTVEDALAAYQTSNDAAVATAKKAGDDAAAALAAYQTSNNAAVAAAQNAADTAQDEVDALEIVVAGIKTTADAAATKTALDEEITRAKAAEKVNSDAIGVLNGTGEGSVKKAIDDAFNDFSTKVSDDSVVNSYKELIDWAAEHGSDAAEMAAAISALEAIVDGIGGEGEKATIIAYIEDKIAAINADQYATDAELAAAVARIATNETAIASLKNGTVVAKEAEHATTADTATSAESADKTVGTLIININGSEAAAFDGSGNKSVSITPSTVGAATAAQGAKADTAVQTVTTGSANGTIAVDGTDVAVKGLGSAAYTESNAYATAAQGGKADTAIQTVSVLGKTLNQTNNTISVAEAKTALGLGSAAYTESNAYATAAQGSKADTALQSIAVSDGLSITEKGNGTTQTISIDTATTFIFNCGTASTVI